MTIQVEVYAIDIKRKKKGGRGDGTEWRRSTGCLIFFQFSIIGGDVKS